MISQFSILLLSLVSQVIAGTATYGSLTYDTGAFNQFNMADMLSHHNQARATGGVGPLVIDSRLFQAAVVHCQTMLSTGIFDHIIDGSSPSDRATNQGFIWSVDEENIYETTQGTDALVATNAYMDSPPHKSNIMNAAVTRAGFAVCGNQGGMQYWVSQFAEELTSTGDRFLVNGSSTLVTAANPSTPVTSNPVAPVDQVVPVAPVNNNAPNTAAGSSDAYHASYYSKRSRTNRG